MMKITSFGLVYTIITFGTCGLWFYWQSKKNSAERETNKQQEIKGKVVRMFMPEMQKKYHIFFASGQEYISPFLASSDPIEIGDSIYKPAGEEWFIVYRNGNLKDTTRLNGVFELY